MTTSTLEKAGSCPTCHYVMPSLVECAPMYFKDGFVVCAHCKARADLWQVVLDKATRLSMAPGWALANLRAGQTSFVETFETGRFYEVDLTKREVPADARILTRSYTGQGGDVTVMEWHPNAPPLRFQGTTLRLVGVPLGEGALPREGQVAISVVWIRNNDSDAWPFLVTAFEAAAARDYAPALVFAQSAVEISMMPLVESRLPLHASAERVDRFMTESLTFNHALNVVLPYLCGEKAVAQMPNSVRGALNKLRKKRNDIIHKGVKVASVTPEDAMEGLCAAAFGFEYMRYVGPRLSGTNGIAQKAQP